MATITLETQMLVNASNDKSVATCYTLHEGELVRLPLKNQAMDRTRDDRAAASLAGS